MADRRDYYYLELVTEAELDAGFEGLEVADRALVADAGLIGVATGLAVSQHTPQNLTVDVSAGSAYDQDGQRLAVAASQNVNMAVDYLSVSTSVAGGGNEKWLALFIEFDRALDDPRLDGNAVTVYFERNESFAFKVVQGAEAAIGLATRPALLGDAILLADVRLINGQTQILTADISTSRREWAFSASAGTVSVAVGTAEEAVSSLVTQLNAHLVDAADAHAASAVGYGGGASWAGGTSPTNPAATVEAQLDKILTDLSAVAAGASGGHRVGIATAVGSPDSLAQTTVHGQIGELLTAVNARARKASAETIGGAWGFTGACTFDNITATSTNKYKLASRSITRMCHAVGNPDGSAWNYLGNVFQFEQLIADATEIEFILPVPDGARITAIKMYINPPNGHAAVPATVPRIRLISWDPTGGGTETVLATGTDASASAAAFDAAHTVEATGLTVDIDKSTLDYFISIRGEAGANSLNSLNLNGVEVTFTTTAMPDGALSM